MGVERDIVKFNSNLNSRKFWVEMSTETTCWFRAYPQLCLYSDSNSTPLPLPLFCSAVVGRANSTTQNTTLHPTSQLRTHHRLRLWCHTPQRLFHHLVSSLQILPECRSDREQAEGKLAWGRIHRPSAPCPEADPRQQLQNRNKGGRELLLWRPRQCQYWSLDWEEAWCHWLKLLHTGMLNQRAFIFLYTNIHASKCWISLYLTSLLHLALILCSVVA